MKNILKTLVGSRAHGLHDENSDYDWRGVFMEDITTHLSPFRKVKNNHWIEGDEDNTSYELTQFIKGCCQGNPNYLEVVYSPKIEFLDQIGSVLVCNRSKFLNTKRIFEAHSGYAQNQYKKMNLFDPNSATPKFAVAYIRALHNGAELLRTGELCVEIQDDQLKDDLRAIKYDFKNHLDLAMLLFSQKQKEINDARYIAEEKEPDIAFWEDFINNSYTQ